MSGAYSSEAAASTSQIPMYSGSAQSFAARARAKMESQQSRLAPPPGFSMPASSPSGPSRGRQRIPSPNFYGVREPRERRGGNTKVMLPITPSLSASTAIMSPSTPSPIPRTPSPPPMIESSPFYQHTPNPEPPRSRLNEPASYPLPKSTAASTAGSSSTVEKKTNKVLRKKSVVQPSASKPAMRTGSTTSTGVSTASYTTSTSASHVERSHGSNSVFGSVPPTSYTYRQPASSAGTRHIPRVGPPPGFSSISGPGNAMQRSRSGSGSQSSGTSAQLSTMVPKPGSVPPPLTIPAAAAENYNSSPSTANCGSPGMFSYNSTPTSSSTNPSLLQSPPGFSPPVQRVRNSSPTRPLISKYAGVTAAADKLGKAIASKSKDGNEIGPEPKQIKQPSRNSLIPTNLSSSSLSIPKTRDTKAPSPDLISKIAQTSKHARKTSKDLLPPKSNLTAGLGGFHFRKSSKDLSASSTPTSQIGRPTHSRQSSRDSSNVRSPGESSQASAGYFPSMTSPIPIPVPSPNPLRSPPSRPSRDGAPDELEGVGSEVPVIQSGIVAGKGTKSKGTAMKIPTSTSLPRATAPFGNMNGSTSSVNLASTSVPGKAKSSRAPTPTSATGTTVVHGFYSAASSSNTSLSTKPSDSSPRKLTKESRKNSLDKGTVTAVPPPTRPSFFRTRKNTVPGPAAVVTPAEKEKSLAQKRPGPAAGTGHEGYQTSKTPRSRSSSGSAIPSTSSKPTIPSSTPPNSLGRSGGAKALKSPEMDPFFAGRLEPVVIKSGVAMARSSSLQSNSSSLPKQSIKADSQKSSLDLQRTNSSRDPSFDAARKNGFEGFDFGLGISAQRRPSLTVETLPSRTSGESPTTAIMTKPPSKALAKPTSIAKPEEKDVKLKASKKLIPQPVVTIPQPSKRWFVQNPFAKPKSAPAGFRGNHKPEAAPTKTAPQSPVLGQEVKYPDVHLPPVRKTTQEIPRVTKASLQRAESVLLPEPPVMPRSLGTSRTPSPVTVVRTNPPGLPVPKGTMIISRTPSPAGLIRPPPGLPIPPELIISVTTPSQSTKIRTPPGFANASPVSAMGPSPSSAVHKSVSPQVTSNRPSPGSLPSRDIQKLVEQDQQASQTRLYNKDDDEESDEYTDEGDYIDSEDEKEEKEKKTDSQTFLLDSKTATPVLSPPATPKSGSVTPEDKTNPSPGGRPRLGAFAVRRIRQIQEAADAPKTEFKTPKLIDILPPPPSIRDHQLQPQPPIKIQPPRRMAHPPAEQAHSPSSSGEDDGGEGPDYINTRKLPLHKLAPLITGGWHQMQLQNKRISEHTDEWAEYDDFLDEMSATTPRSKTPLGAPFPDIGIFKPDVQDERQPSRRLKDSPTLPSAATFGVVSNFAPSNKKKLVLDQGKLAMGRPLAARPLFSPALPTARSSLFGVAAKEPESQRSSSTYSQRSSGNQKTIAFADFISAYANVDRGVMSVIDPLDKSKHTSATARKMGLLSPMSSVTDFEDTDSSDSESFRQSIISAMPGTEDALEGEMKVRLWALMTSRWLSFGRVLVSPAHEEIKKSGATGNRILVVDGLGNDDWSFYCSLNYPNATVYNLTPSQATYPMSPAGNKATSPTGSDDGLSNHHQIHHGSFASPFPFPSGFFSVVTFRFLPANSDALWPFIISQCMRVLKPGGHLELSVLDIDMVNMGQRTKRNIDEIKMNLKKQQAGNGSDWFKKTPSEKALRLLAKRGFTDITRCRVGLPTVGNVDGSREEQASMQQILKEGNSPDEVDMNSAEGINRVVSKVGRWWYTKCFENLGLDEQESLAYQRSIWEDKTLLRECEKKKTNFRMLITFAKKPSDWRD